MKVSIITVCYNSQDTIEDTIKSVLDQNYTDIEYIIIDGKSTDNTLKIIDKYKDKITRIISEKDNGIYHAFNKGITLATGEIIGFLNSDDIYSNENIIGKIVSEFIQKGTDSLYADLVFIDKYDTSKVIRYWEAGAYKHGLFINGWMPPHPTFFVKKRIYEKYGYYNTNLSISADYELMLRLIHKYNVSVAYIPATTIKMRMGGSSNLNWLTKIKANREDRLAWKINGLKPGFLTLIIKPLSKATQFFRKPHS